MKVIITGSSGMVGKSVLMECLKSNDVSEVLLINRSSINIYHSKIKEVIHKDFLDFYAIREKLKGYNACFHCMGVSSNGISQENYYKLTYKVTNNLANTLYQLNSSMVFLYVSGQGTDSLEKSSIAWARIKGKTENMLFNIGFKNVVAFRLGAIIPGKGITSKISWINILLVSFKPLFPLMRKFDSITTSEKLGKAMINVVKNPPKNKIINNKEINILADN